MYVELCSSSFPSSTEKKVVLIWQEFNIPPGTSGIQFI